jgi:hypothetical protein
MRVPDLRRRACTALAVTKEQTKMKAVKRATEKESQSSNPLDDFIVSRYGRWRDMPALAEDYSGCNSTAERHGLAFGRRQVRLKFQIRANQ